MKAISFTSKIFAFYRSSWLWNRLNRKQGLGPCKSALARFCQPLQMVFFVVPMYLETSHLELTKIPLSTEEIILRINLRVNLLLHKIENIDQYSIIILITENNFSFLKKKKIINGTLFCHSESADIADWYRHLKGFAAIKYI